MIRSAFVVRPFVFVDSRDYVGKIKARCLDKWMGVAEDVDKQSGVPVDLASACRSPKGDERDQCFISIVWVLIYRVQD